MNETTTELTNEYIKEHPDIKSCLKKGLINYSSLARTIAKDLGIEKNTSKDAILVAARRFKESLKKDIVHEKKIKEILAETEIEIKNKIAVFILEKSINLDMVDEIQHIVRKESGTIYITEGYDSYTLITQEKYASLVRTTIKNKVIKQKTDLVMINLKSPKEIEHTRGVLAFIFSLCAENGVNVQDTLSCWTDTLFVIDEKDLSTSIKFLKF